jgi:hypothetical protein
MKTARALTAMIALAAPGILAAAPATAAVPSNDLPSGAIAVSDGFSETRDTTEATTDAYDTQAVEVCQQPNTGASVWYSFTSVTDVAVRVDVSASSYSAAVAVAVGEPGDLSPLTCFGVSPGHFGTPGLAIFEATAGTTYSILVFDNQDDGGGNGGTLDIEVSVPVRPTIAVTIDPVGRVDARTGVATLTGTFTCTNASQLIILGGVWQGRSSDDDPMVFGQLQVGYLDASDCDGTLQLWSADVASFDGKFRGGRADVAIDGTVCTSFSCVGVEMPHQAVQLRGGGR